MNLSTILTITEMRSDLKILTNFNLKYVTNVVAKISRVSRIQMMKWSLRRLGPDPDSLNLLKFHLNSVHFLILFELFAV